MKEIGGYFELEHCSVHEAYHEQAIAVNSGRNALEYILRSKNIQRIWLPDFFCDALLDPIQKLGLDYRFYHVNRQLEIAGMPDGSDAVLYINYFGLKEEYVSQLAAEYGSALIVDNSLSFFSKPLPRIATFYSCRKFFGVPDGGYVYNVEPLAEQPEYDNSAERYKHLVGRIDGGASAYYADYAAAEKLFGMQELKRMSRSTQQIMHAIDYDRAALQRRRNYAVLHQALKSSNALELPEDGTFMCFPYLQSAAGLKQKLISNKIYVPTYWPNVLHKQDSASAAYELASNLVCLPIDHRYNENDMRFILKTLNS